VASTEHGFHRASEIADELGQRCPACHHEGPKVQHGEDAQRKCRNEHCRVGLYRETAIAEGNA
jgi:hypothetical protein